MTVIVLTNCPPGLRGFLTRWLLEIPAGVFIGNPSARIRDALWDEVQQYAGQGRALLAHTTNNEQGFIFRTHDHAWHPTDHEGLTLIRRPNNNTPPQNSEPPPGWSKASKRRRFGRN
ncbi:type I-E CRISPR-associated endoribonuclease Cas2e [Streptomyces sp. NPDC057620]|uniref:type I-E CRISPR-associated endoribonuclease Cas2e n=1 Tax=Streptomyces sp. NPDC057620 TaxID=3346185 RepID=UPI0036795E7F